MKTAVVDLDGVLAEERPAFEHALAAPLPGAAEGLRTLKRLGFHIVIHTARGWGEYAVTKHWLQAHSMEHDLLLCGKPIADIVIDDRAIRFRGWEGLTDAV